MSEYTRKINRGYQLTIPQAFRDTYNLQIGDYLKIQEENGKLIIEPVRIAPKNPIAALEALFGSTSENFSDLSEEQILNLVRSELKRSRQESASKTNKGKTKQ